MYQDWDDCIINSWRGQISSQSILRFVLPKSRVATGVTIEGQKLAQLSNVVKALPITKYSVLVLCEVLQHFPSCSCCWAVETSGTCRGPHAQEWFAKVNTDICLGRNPTQISVSYQNGIFWNLVNSWDRRIPKLCPCTELLIKYIASWLSLRW